VAERFLREHDTAESGAGVLDIPGRHPDREKALSAWGREKVLRKGEGARQLRQALDERGRDLRV